MKENKKLVLQLIYTAIIMAICMTVYETVKQAISPDITIWESHMVTILFSTFFAVAVAFFIIKKQNRLNSRLKARNLESERLRKELEDMVFRLEEKISQIKLLSGMLPICASCKKIRDDKGYWNQIESYIKDHSEAEFSHSICPECEKKLYS